MSSCLSSECYSIFKAVRYTLEAVGYTSKSLNAAAWPQPSWVHFATAEPRYCTQPQAGHTFHSSCLIDHFHPYRSGPKNCFEVQHNDEKETHIATITHGIYAPKPFRFIPLSHSHSKSFSFALNYHEFPAKLSDSHLYSKSSSQPKYQIFP